MGHALRVTDDASAQRRPIDPDGYLWRNAGLVTFPLTSGSAFILQAMHPTIGTVVDEHSSFRTDAIGRAARSTASVMTWVYGGPEALAEGDRLRAMHASLNSYDDRGVRHTALSSAPYAWVTLTGSHAFEATAKYFSLRSPNADELEAMYQELLQVALNLHVAPKELPATLAECRQLIDDVMANTLVAHPVAYDALATFKRIPPPPQLPRALRPAWQVATFVPGRVQHFVTVGTLPGSARTKLGLTWTPRDEAVLRAVGLGVALTFTVLPERLKYLPIAYEARKAERANRRLAKILSRRPR